jgi:hypothetical protein
LPIWFILEQKSTYDKTDILNYSYMTLTLNWPLSSRSNYENLLKFIYGFGSFLNKRTLMTKLTMKLWNLIYNLFKIVMFSKRIYYCNIFSEMCLKLERFECVPCQGVAHVYVIIMIGKHCYWEKIEIIVIHVLNSYTHSCYFGVLNAYYFKLPHLFPYNC